MKKKISLIILILFLLFILFYGQKIYQEFKISFEKRSIENKFEKIEDDIFSKYTDLDLNKKSEKLNYEDFIDGFWYEKNDSLFYFNVEEFIKKGYSKEDILKLIEKIKGSKITKSNNIEYINSKNLPEDINFFNQLNSSSLSLSPELKYNDIKSNLENKKNKKVSDYQKLSQIYSLEGNYGKVKELQVIICKLDKNLCKKHKIEIKGRVVNQSAAAVSGAEVYLASDKNNKVKTKPDGSYVLKAYVNKLNKTRLIIKKFGYATTFQGIISVSENQKEYKVPQSILYEGKYSFVLNNKSKKVNNNGVYENKNFILKTSNSKYIIPEDAFYTEEGKVYKGKINVSLFEFNENTVPESLISLDSFSEQSGLNGSFMITFGMPYAIFNDNNGKNLYILKKNPIILEYTPDENNKSNFSERDWSFILEKSKSKEYYFTVENISKTFLELIPFWSLDQKTGVWHNTGFDILDKKETLRTIFFTSLK